MGSGFGDQWVSVRGTSTCTCAVGKGTDTRTRTGASARHSLTHTRTHAPTYNMKAEEGSRREGKRRGQEGLGAQAVGHRCLGGVLPAGGLGSGGRRRWSLVSSWWQDPMVEARRRHRNCAVPVTRGVTGSQLGREVEGAPGGDQPSGVMCSSRTQTLGWLACHPRSSAVYSSPGLSLRLVNRDALLPGNQPCCCRPAAPSPAQALGTRAGQAEGQAGKMVLAPRM